MCLGNDEQTSTQKVDKPEWLNSAAKSNIGYAKDVQEQGFTPYNGDMVAGFSPQQQSSFGLGNDVASGVQPSVGNTGNWVNSYATGDAGHVQPNTIASMMSPYMSAYVRDALQPSLELQNLQFNDQNKSFDSAATGAGAFGDTGWGIGRSNLTKSQDAARSGLVSDAYQRAFNTAIGAGAQDVSNDVNAQTTNANLGETALNRKLQGASAAFNMGTGATNLQNTLGGQQTAQEQAKLNSQYNEFLRMMYQDPKFRADIMNQSIAAGNAGADTTTTTTQPNNAGYGLLGAGLGAAGSFAGSEAGATALIGLVGSDPDLKENDEQVGELYDGTPVHRFNYKDDPKKTQVIGLMSPEVRPDAVDDTGPFDRVDYGAATEDAAAIGRDASGGEDAAAQSQTFDPFGGTEQPYREMRGVKSAARAQPPTPPSMSTDDVWAGLKKMLVGDSDAKIKVPVDSQGNPEPYQQLPSEFAKTNPGQTHPGVELGADYGMMSVAPNVARPFVKPLVEAAARSPRTTGNVAGAATAAASGSNAGVESDRLPSTFEVDMPEADPRLVAQRNALQQRIDEIDKKLGVDVDTAESTYQKRAGGRYPSTKARELDFEGNERNKTGLRDAATKQQTPLRDEMKGLDTQISDLQTKQKGERQSEAKAKHDLAMAKAEREKPLTERFPSLMALPYIGAIYSGGVTMANRANAIKRYDQWVERFEGQLAKVDGQAAASEKFATETAKRAGMSKAAQKRAKPPEPGPSDEAMTREKDALGEYVKGAPAAEKAIKPGLAEKAESAFSGSLIATELAAVPYLIDMATQKPDTKAGQEAARKLKTLDGWMSTLQSTATAGVLGAGVGNSWPMKPKAQPNIERARVLSAPPAAPPAPAPAPPPPQVPAGIPPAMGPKAWMARQLNPAGAP